MTVRVTDEDDLVAAALVEAKRLELENDKLEIEVAKTKNEAPAEYFAIQFNRMPGNEERLLDWRGIGSALILKTGDCFGARETLWRSLPNLHLQAITRVTCEELDGKTAWSANLEAPAEWTAELFNYKNTSGIENQWAGRGTELSTTAKECSPLPPDRVTFYSKFGITKLTCAEVGASAPRWSVEIPPLQP